MHELGIATDLAKAVGEVARTHPERQVTHVQLLVGELRGIVPDVMAFCWDAAIKDTPLEGAHLTIDTVSAAGRCRCCEAEFDVHDLMFVCPACSSGNVETLRGKELILDKVELN